VGLGTLGLTKEVPVLLLKVLVLQVKIIPRRAGRACVSMQLR
jgi:hypothetical protein